MHLNNQFASFQTLGAPGNGIVLKRVLDMPGTASLTRGLWVSHLVLGRKSWNPEAEAGGFLLSGDVCRNQIQRGMSRSRTRAGETALSGMKIAELRKVQTLPWLQFLPSFLLSASTNSHCWTEPRLAAKWQQTKAWPKIARGSERTQSCQLLPGLNPALVSSEGEMLVPETLQCQKSNFRWLQG